MTYVHAKGDGFPDGFFEELPTRRLSENLHEICAIPLFARNLALGDVVSTTVDELERLVAITVVKRSGRYDYRIWLGKIPQLERIDLRHHIVDRLTQLGCLLERYSDSLLGIDAPDREVARKTVDFLLEHEPSGLAIEAANE
jgi:hypothetical protein